MNLRDSPAAAILATIQRQTHTPKDRLVGYEHIQKGLKEKGVQTNLQSLRVYVQRLKKRKLIKTQYITYTNNTYAYFNLTKKGHNLLNKWQQILDLHPLIIQENQQLRQIVNASKIDRQKIEKLVDQNQKLRKKLNKKQKKE